MRVDGQVRKDKSKQANLSKQVVTHENKVIYIKNNIKTTLFSFTVTTDNKKMVKFCQNLPFILHINTKQATFKSKYKQPISNKVFLMPIVVLIMLYLHYI